jgi:hypothetical protein
MHLRHSASLQTYIYCNSRAHITSTYMTMRHLKLYPTTPSRFRTLSILACNISEVLAAQKINYGRRGQRHGPYPTVILPWLGRRIAGRNSQRRTGSWNPLAFMTEEEVSLCPLDGIMSRAYWRTCDDIYPGLCKPDVYLHIIDRQRIPVSAERCTPSPGLKRTQAQTLLDTSASVVGPHAQSQS